MIHLGTYGILEIIFGLFFWWVGIYFLSKNPTTILSWLVFGFLGGLGVVIFADPVYGNAQTLGQYAFWQKILDWPLFFGPIFCFHASLLTQNKKVKLNSYLLFIAYFIASIIFILDIKSNLIVHSDLLRSNLSLNEKRYGYIFTPGKLLIPTIFFESSFLILTAINFIRKSRTELIRYLLPILGTILIIISAVLIWAGYYTSLPYSAVYFNILLSIGVLLFVYSMIRYQLYSPAESTIFNRNFFYRTIGVFSILLFYLSVLRISGIAFNYSSLVLLTLLLPAVITTHSFYEWFTTFINDFLYNISSGLSVVSDNEIYQAIKNYNQPESLENSTLLRLNLINKKLHQDELKTPVDALRKTIREAIDYFKPDENPHKRNKKNLKYELLRILTLDEAEEGQILWELGFEEYPVRIMTKERQLRPPMFKIESPSDYTYTSRNAYLALKKEAVHDITWRISYLEKLSKKKLI